MGSVFGSNLGSKNEGFFIPKQFRNHKLLRETGFNVNSAYNIDFDKLVKCEEANKVIALGNVASDSLRKVNVEHFKMPHPSPRNRQLNDKQFEKISDNILQS